VTQPLVSSPPSLRADARRNRDAILAAARDVFAESGLDAPLDLIAKRAGVGRATLYRRFPTREDLIGAIFDDNFELLVEVGRSSENQADSYLDILYAALDQQRASLGFNQLFSRMPPEGPAMDAIQDRWAGLIAEPLQRAKDAGIVREDLNVLDTGLLIIMIGAVTAHLVTMPDSERQRERAITLIRDAIDPRNAQRPLP
jgi:AcrR family transcriptional regulator